MTEEIATADAEAGKISVDKSNISVTDFAQRRIGELTPKAEQPQEEEPQEAPEQENEEVEEVSEVQEQPEAEETEEAAEESQESEDVLSQLDLDDMSEEDLRELADKLGSRAVARFGELTAKRKAAEEKLTQLEAQLKEKPNLLEAKKVENNPYGNLDTIDKLQEKSAEVDQVVEWAEDLIFESDGYGADDIVTEVEGKEWTKKDVRQALLKARKAQKTFLPAQLKQVQAQQQGEKLTEQFNQQAKKELDWY